MGREEREDKRRRRGRVQNEESTRPIPLAKKELGIFGKWQKATAYRREEGNGGKEGKRDGGLKGDREGREGPPSDCKYYDGGPTIHFR